MTESYKGKCYACGNVYTKRGMRHHLKSCKKLKEKFRECGENKYFMIRIKAKYAKQFFLYLDIKANVKLSELDQFLRDIWLECCNHLSCFKINNESYTFPVENSHQSDIRLINIANKGEALNISVISDLLLLWKWKLLR